MINNSHSNTTMDIMEQKSQRPLNIAERSSSTSSINGSIKSHGSKRKKNYIVTGGAGFLGSHIVEHLLNLEHNVIVLDKQYPSNDILMQIEQSSNNGKSKFILCDITRYNDVYRAFNFLKKQYQQQLKLQKSSQDQQSSSSSLDINDDKSIDSANSSLNTFSTLNTCSSSSDIIKQYKIDCVFHCAALTDPWAPR